MAIAAVCSMPTTEPAPSTTAIRDRFLADHHRLDALLSKLSAAFEANDPEDVAKLWTDFESGLLAHLEAEEATMIPALLRACARDARVIVQEHRHIRSRLAELGVAVDLHTIRLDTARDFIDELFAHAENEDRLLYRWADGHLGEPERVSALSELAARFRARRKIAAAR